MPALALSCNNPPNGSISKPYTQTFIASGGTPPYFNFILFAGAFPPGLTLNSTTGVLSGVPTTLGTFAFSIQVSDTVPNTATVACSISICGLNAQGS